MSAALYGLLAEFASADDLLDAVRRARAVNGHARLDAYSPFPVDGLAEALGARRCNVPLWMLLGALIGGLGTYALEWFSAVVNYPLDVGGRPYASWPAFLPAALEITLLGAALGGVISMFAGSGLPRLHHPLFAMAAFSAASNDRFFLVWRAQGAGFDAAAAREFLEALAPLNLSEVPA